MSSSSIHFLQLCVAYFLYPLVCWWILCFYVLIIVYSPAVNMGHSFNTYCVLCEGFPSGSVIKTLPDNAGDVGSIPGLGMSRGGGDGHPVQYSCLENSMNKGASWATVHGVPKKWIQLGNWACTHMYFVLCIILGIEDTTLKQQTKIPAILELIFKELRRCTIKKWAVYDIAKGNKFFGEK